MDDARPLLGGDEVGGEHPEGPRGVGEEREEGPVAPAHQLGALQRPHPGGPGQLALVGSDGGLAQDVAHPVVLEHGVVDVGAHGQDQVGGQRPRCRGPHQDAGGRLAFFLGLEVEEHGQGGVLALAGGVVLPGLEVGQGRLALPAVGEDAVALVEQPLLPQLLEGPHDALHVGEVHGLVVAVEVHPPPLAGHVAPPLLGVTHDRSAAVGVEQVDAVGGDAGPAVDLQGLLRLGLGRKAVAVPAEAALDPAPAHGVVAGDDVLDEAGQEVAVVGQAVGEGGTVVEDVLVLAPGTGLHRGLKGPVLGPVGQDFLLEGRELGLGGDCGVGAR